LPNSDKDGRQSGAVIEDVARQRKVTPRAVIEALPPEMRWLGTGGEFASAMQDIARGAGR
jgi:hypothetical protein